MLIVELEQLGANPYAWGVVALLWLMLAQSVYLLFRCPYTIGTATISDDEVAAARGERFDPGARFALTMLAGAALTVTGLFLIAQGVLPAIALGALVGGIVLIQTEPARLEIRERIRNVVAGRDGDAEHVHGLRDRLKATRRKLGLINLAMLVAVVVALLAF